MTPTSPSFEAPQQRVSGSGLDGSNSGLSRSRRAILWLLVAAACALYIYRINTFTPQPLDSSNTLRPILNRWFIAFLRLYAHPEPALAAWKNFCAIVLFIPPVLAMLDFVREHGMLNLPDRAARALCSRTLLFVSSAISLTACRYPA